MGKKCIRCSNMRRFEYHSSCTRVFEYLQNETSAFDRHYSSINIKNYYLLLKYLKRGVFLLERLTKGTSLIESSNIDWITVTELFIHLNTQEFPLNFPSTRYVEACRIFPSIEKFSGSSQGKLGTTPSTVGHYSRFPPEPCSTRGERTRVRTTDRCQRMSRAPGELEKVHGRYDESSVHARQMAASGEGETCTPEITSSVLVPEAFWRIGILEARIHRKRGNFRPLTKVQGIAGRKLEIAVRCIVDPHPNRDCGLRLRKGGRGSSDWAPKFRTRRNVNRWL